MPESPEQLQIAGGFRVVRIYFRLPPEPGGMEAHIESLTDAQRKLGVEVLNVHNTGVATGSSLQLLGKWDLLRIRPAVLRNAIFYSAALWNSSSMRAGSEPIVLHVHGDWSDFLFSKLLAAAIGARLVVASLHAKVPSERLSFVYRGVLSHCKLLFSTGKRDQVLLERVLGRTVHHLPSAPAEVFFSENEPEQKEVDVITVANCQRVKRLELLIDCAQRRPDMRFAVYGDGPERPNLVRDAERRGLTNIAFRGHRPKQEIAEAMKGAKLFVLPSAEEGTPTAALEAMASGLPVVLTPSNDYAWLVQDGVNGFVTTSWAVDELLARIDAVLSAPEQRAQMRRANRLRARQHAWESSGLRVSELMAAALEHGEKHDALAGSRLRT